METKKVLGTAATKIETVKFWVYEGGQDVKVLLANGNEVKMSSAAFLDKYKVTLTQRWLQNRFFFRRS